MAVRNYKTSPVFSVRLAGFVVAGAFAALSAASVGCASKNYVRAQTAPVVQNINGLDERTAADHRAIADTDERATKGINGAMDAANAADKKAVAAGASADSANDAATGASHRVDSLSGVIAGLDQYKSLADVSVTFAFDKSALTATDKQLLDGIASTLQTTRGYILQVTGGTDSVGNAEYNYALSQRRADAVVNYLSVKYNVPPHKFYLVGIGKDVQVASDKTAAGRAQNRRVEVQLLSNMTTVAAN